MTETRGRGHTSKSRLPTEVEAIIRWVVDDALARGGRADDGAPQTHMLVDRPGDVGRRDGDPPVLPQQIHGRAPSRGRDTAGIPAQ